MEESSCTCSHSPVAVEDVLYVVDVEPEYVPVLTVYLLVADFHWVIVLLNDPSNAFAAVKEVWFEEDVAVRYTALDASVMARFCELVATHVDPSVE